jgi:hypothetical protein
MQEDDPADAPARPDAALASPLRQVFGLLVDEYCKTIRKRSPQHTDRDKAAHLKDWHEAGVKAIRHMEGLHRLVARLSGGPGGGDLPRTPDGRVDVAFLRAQAQADLAALDAKPRGG